MPFVKKKGSLQLIPCTLNNGSFTEVVQCNRLVVQKLEVLINGLFKSMPSSQRHKRVYTFFLKCDLHNFLMDTFIPGKVMA